MQDKKIINNITQVTIPVLTIAAQTAVAAKYPQWGLIIAAISQPFWLYSSWKSYKNAGQIGIFINTCLFLVVTLIGIANYWFW